MKKQYFMSERRGSKFKRAYAAPELCASISQRLKIKAMPVPPAPPPLEELGHRPFAFYPSILNVEHNEWLYRRATWSEILVENTKTHEEIWMPRRYLGEISRVDEPIMIVGLLKELEYKTGALWPVERRVIEMPRAVNDTPRPAFERTVARPAPVLGIRVENTNESRIGRFLFGGVALGIAGCILAVSLYRGGVVGSHYVYQPVPQADLALSFSDDYSSIVRQFGAPAEDRWRPNTGELQYRALYYPRRGLYLILMGRERETARYIGAMDRNWRPVHAVEMPGRASSHSLLRSLRKF